MKKSLGITAAICIAALPAAALADSARSLRDLVGGRANIDGAMAQRGFVYIDGHKDYSSSYTYWWKQAADDCVQVTTRDGRIASITDVNDKDCHHHDEGEDVAAAAAVGVVGAAILGSILGHKSHHHNDNKHHDDRSADQIFEEGYRDGLYNHAYHNPRRSNDYSDGYSQGVEEREHQSSHRRGHHRGHGGYVQKAACGDLNGARASSADGELGRRGFRNVDGFKSGSTAYTIWSNRATNQCLQMTVADGRVYDIRDIGRHPKC